MIRAEKASGARRDGRTELQVLLDFLRPGDALVGQAVVAGEVIGIMVAAFCHGFSVITSMMTLESTRVTSVAAQP